MTPNTRELKFQARVLLSGKTGFLALATFLITVLDLGLTFILDSAFPGTGSWLNVILYYAGGLLCNMVYYILLAGLTRIYLNICRKRQVKISDLFYVFSDRPEQIAVYSILQYALVTAVGYVFRWGLSGIWFSSGSLLIYAVVLLTVSIVYLFLQLCLVLVLFLYCDDPSKSAVQLVKESWQLMRGNKGRMFCLELSFWGLTILSFLSLGIGALFVRPYLFLAQTLFYLNLDKAQL